METRANYLLVGSFVLIMAFGLLAFVVWLGKFQFDSAVAHYDIKFEGSVTGLQVGSDVRYTGVRVGEVTIIALDRDDPKKVWVTIEVAAETPIRNDTYAQLELQGLTGGLYVLLSGGSAEAGPLARREKDDLPIIPSRPSNLAQVLEEAPELIQKANLLLTRATLLFNDENQKHVAAILRDLATLTNSFAGKTDQIEKIFKEASDTMINIRDATKSIAGLTENLDSGSKRLIERAETTLNSVDKLATNLNATVAEAGDDIDAMVKNVNGTATAYTKLANEATAMLAENREPIRDFTSRGLYDLTSLIIESRQFLIGLNQVTTQVGRDPSSLIFGNQNQGYQTGQ